MIKRIFTLTLMMIVLLSLTNCLDFLKSNEDDENPLIGKWVIYRVVEKEFEDGTLTDSWDEIYDGEWDNYMSAWFLEFTKDVVTMYENDDGTDYWEDQFDYKINNDKIISDEDEVAFNIENDMLVIEYEDEFERDGATYTSESKEYYKKYEGDIPPDSWVELLHSDSYEDDDVYSDATNITVNATPQAHTITSGDEDWYSFTATSSQNYLLVVGSYEDMIVTLYDTDGSSYLDDDDDNDYDIQPSNFDYPVESVLFWSAPASGTYYFKVTGYDSSDEGYYVMTVMETSMTSPFAKAVINNTPKKEKRTRHHFLNKQ